MTFSKEHMLMVVDGDCPTDDYEIVEQSDWTVDHKYEYRDTIFSFKGEFFMITEGRSGSYFTEYNYDSEYWNDEVETTAVEQVEVTIKEWRAIK